MSKIIKSTKKHPQPRLSKTRKATVRKKADQRAENPSSWITRPKSKKEKELHALRNSHPRRERDQRPCLNAPVCKKQALSQSVYCAKHTDARVNIPQYMREEA